MAFPVWNRRRLMRAGALGLLPAAISGPATALAAPRTVPLAQATPAPPAGQAELHHGSSRF